ncbi:site-specific DNA-methyltransferase [Anaerosacchariphilus polymeriproducens]|uniref:site-specific DNA-methyltransferase n=1 Tax=Anaerosacchariphilus polymeriproducens TaxID=1812858 RepID=UPI00195FBEA3|nr:site-specific DNA-methyltransferase [Anaerosacchariphilus polymeriproducens]
MRKYENVNINKLIPYARNARTHNAEQIKKLQASIREFGFLNPILIDEKFNIIAGHARIEAAKEEGRKEVPCLFVEDLTEAQKKAYLLADNRLALDAGWDMELLKLEIEELKELNFDLNLTGFQMEELDDFIFGEEEEVKEDDYEIELPEKPKSKEGDLYQLGRHRLLCGDSTNQEVIKRLLGDNQADLFITDPPYNVAYEGKTKDAMKILNDCMESDSFRKFLVDSFWAADKVMRPGAAFYIWHADSEGYNFRGACLEMDWKVRQCLIWNKNAMVLGRQDYQWKHEPCLYGWKPGAPHVWENDRSQTTILNFDRPNRNVEHPTMKPILLFDYQIKNNTKPGEIVLDSFAGSGTTIMACEQNGRNAYCCELDPKYVDVIINRWESFSGEKAQKVVVV